jgi:hypothetical protein
MLVVRGREALAARCSTQDSSTASPHRSLLTPRKLRDPLKAEGGF